MNADASKREIAEKIKKKLTVYKSTQIPMLYPFKSMALLQSQTGSVKGQMGLVKYSNLELRDFGRK